MAVFILDCSVTNAPKRSSLKRLIFVISVSVWRDHRHSLAGSSAQAPKEAGKLPVPLPGLKAQLLPMCSVPPPPRLSLCPHDLAVSGPSDREHLTFLFLNTGT